MEFGRVFFALGCNKFSRLLVYWTDCCYEGRNSGTEPHLAWVTCFRHLESHPSLSGVNKDRHTTDKLSEEHQALGLLLYQHATDQPGWAARAQPTPQPCCRRTTFMDRIAQSTLTGSMELNRIMRVGSYTALFPLSFFGPQQHVYK